jgi:hypothetical protein
MDTLIEVMLFMICLMLGMMLFYAAICVVESAKQAIRNRFRLNSYRRYRRVL